VGRKLQSYREEEEEHENAPTLTSPPKTIPPSLPAPKEKRKRKNTCHSIKPI
jgi:hypothetical protein